MPDTLDDVIRTALQRAAGKSVSPADIARSIAGSDEKQWRLLMRPIREAAERLAGQSEVILLRKGKPAVAGFKGVYRIALAHSQPQTD